LLVFDPRARKPRRIADPVSHVDLLPTLVEYATRETTPTWVEPIDGRSLVPLIATGDRSGDAQAFAEYTAEGVTGPCCMLRRGKYKYVYTHGHPDLLFDMEADPNELVNIAQQQPQVLAELKQRVLSHWDPEAIARQVIASQARRKFINALPEANQPVWDYQASTDDTRRFVRRGSARVIKVKKRWPRLAGATK
jgi:choline-sulfatase